MPVKRRASKRRLDPHAEAAAWEMIFATGHDHFGELADLGTVKIDNGRVDDDAAEAAWHRLGHLFLAARPAGDRQPWAMRQFGEPGHAG